MPAFNVKLPYLAKPVSIIIVVGLALATAAELIGTRQPIAAFPVTFAAIALLLASTALPIALGAWCGLKFADRTGKAWAGWVLGVVVCLATGLLLKIGVDAIPHIGWRIEAMRGGE